MLWALWIGVGSLVGCSEDAALVDRGVQAFSTWDQLPTLSNRDYFLASSYDRRKKTDYPIVDVGNKDFNNFAASCASGETLLQETVQDALCQEGVEGHVLAALDDGPGYISRIWMAISTLAGPPSLENETIRIYVDALDQPVYQGKLANWRDGNDPIFTVPFVRWTAGALVSYQPISYQSKVWVVLDDLSPFKLYYFQISTVSSDETLAFDASVTDREGMSDARALLTSAGDNPNHDFTLVKDVEPVTIPGANSVDVLDYQGEGTIALLEFEVRQDAPLEQLREVWLQVLWDDRAQPAIDVPLLSLFACWDGLAELRTLPMRVMHEGDRWRLSLYLPMPFSTRARVRLRSEAPEPLSLWASLGLREGAGPRGRVGRLHARYGERVGPAPAGSRVDVLEVTGAGKYVGTVMSLNGRADEEYILPQALNFLEGDETLEVDGQVVGRGTGTEDYFNGGFYFKGGCANHPFSAVNHIWRSDDDAEGIVSVARWHVLSDEIDFGTSLRLSFEVGADKPQLLLRYGSVALYYLQ